MHDSDSRIRIYSGMILLELESDFQRQPGIRIGIRDCRNRVSFMEDESRILPHLGNLYYVVVMLLTIKLGGPGMRSVPGGQ